jgi:hypothetical protein
MSQYPTSNECWRHFYALERKGVRSVGRYVIETDGDNTEVHVDLCQHCACFLLDGGKLVKVVSGRRIEAIRSEDERITKAVGG